MLEVRYCQHMASERFLFELAANKLDCGNRATVLGSFRIDY